MSKYQKNYKERVIKDNDSIICTQRKPPKNAHTYIEMYQRKPPKNTIAYVGAQCISKKRAKKFLFEHKKFMKLSERDHEHRERRYFVEFYDTILYITLFD